MVLLNGMVLNIAICIFEVIVLIFVIIAWSKSVKQKSRNKEISTVQKERARDERLNELLHNELHSSVNPTVQSNIPIEEKFHEETVLRGEQTLGTIEISVTVQSNISTKKYVLFVSDAITIGNGQNNDLVISDADLAKQHCKLFAHDNVLYVQSLDKDKTVSVQRKKDVIPVLQGTVAILNKDVLLLGTTKLTIELL